MILRVVRRNNAGNAVIGGQLHPVLRRVYAARGVQAASDVAPALDRLIPVGTLDGVSDAAALLMKHRENGRILVVGQTDLPDFPVLEAHLEETEWKVRRDFDLLLRAEPR